MSNVIDRDKMVSFKLFTRLMENCGFICYEKFVEELHLSILALIDKNYSFDNMICYGFKIVSCYDNYVGVIPLDSCDDIISIEELRFTYNDIFEEMNNTINTFGYML